MRINTRLKSQVLKWQDPRRLGSRVQNLVSGLSYVNSDYSPRFLSFCLKYQVPSPGLTGLALDFNPLGLERDLDLGPKTVEKNEGVERRTRKVSGNVNSPKRNLSVLST